MVARLAIAALRSGAAVGAGAGAAKTLAMAVRPMRRDIATIMKASDFV